MSHPGGSSKPTKGLVNLRFNNFAKPLPSQISESLVKLQAEERPGISGRYQWRVFVDEPEEVLDKIECVEYLLHPTFPEPRQISWERASKFAIEATGWGEFTLFITVRFKDGTKQEYHYDLDLLKPWP